MLRKGSTLAVRQARKDPLEIHTHVVEQPTTDLVPVQAEALRPCTGHGMHRALLVDNAPGILIKDNILDSGARLDRRPCIL